MSTTVSASGGQPVQGNPLPPLSSSPASAANRDVFIPRGQGDRRADDAPVAVDQRVTARRTADLAQTGVQVPLPRLAPDYDGPVLLVTDEALRPDPIHTPVGAQAMLQAAVQQGVPLVYLPSKGQQTDLTSYPAGVQVGATDLAQANQASGLQGDQGYLQALRQNLPKAQVFLLCGNQGTDMQAAQTPGVTAYVRNTDVHQTDMPKNYAGILTDEYYGPFQARLLQDLQNARSTSLSCGGNPQLRGTLPVLPVYPNAPAIPKETALQKLGKVAHKAAWAASGVAGVVAHGVQQQFHSDKASLALARGPQDALAAATPVALGGVADDILGAKLPALEKSQLLFKVLTSHGTDPGHMDSIVSCMKEPGQDEGTTQQRIEKTLQGNERWAWLSAVKDGQPKVGDWKGDFETYLDGLTGTRVRPGNKVDVCIDGEEAFQKQIAAIQNAKQFINISTFDFSSDQFGRYYLSELEKAAQRGVHINLLVDQTGSAKTYGDQPTDPHLFDTLKKYPNVQFHDTPSSPLDDHINHRKIMTMDDGQGDGGQTGFIGGMNIANDYRIRWHDVHCQVQGPAVDDLNKLFSQQMDAYGGHIDASTAALMAQPQKEQPGGIGVRVVGHWGDQDHNMKMAYLRAINTAQSSIDIADPYVSDPDIMDALIARAKAGVQVRLFVPQHNNHAVLKLATEAYYNKMLAAGVQIYEYNGREMAHDKVAVFDHQTTTIGSSNLDARSLQDNEEANIWSTDPSLAQTVEQRLFQADVPNCQRITSYDPGRTQAVESKVTTLGKGLL